MKTKYETAQVKQVALVDATAIQAGTVQNPEGQSLDRGQANGRPGRRYARNFWRTVSACLGLLSIAGTIQAATLPVITAQPQSRVVNAGTAVDVGVSATGDSLTYEWWNEFGPLYPPQTGATLALSAVKPGDAGRYLVRVRNAAGMVTSAEATLTVNATSADNVLLARTAGGTGADPGANLDTDSAGNVYAVGSFSGTATFGGVTLTSAGGTDVFVVKYAPDRSVVWARRAGGTGDDGGAAVAVDRMGNVRVTGGFSGTSEFGNVSVSARGGVDAFVSCYDRDGNVLWARVLGGSDADRGCRIATDAAGNSYVTGEFSGSASTYGATVVSAGSTDVFLMKLSASGFPLWVKRFGGSAMDRASGLALDATGNVLVTGCFSGAADFGGVYLNSGGPAEVFLLKGDHMGAVAWATKTTGLKSDVGTSVLADDRGNVFLTGAFSGSAIIGGKTVTARQEVDCFLAKFTGAGVVEWVARDSVESKLGLESTAADAVGTLGSGALDWNGGGTPADLMVGRYPGPQAASWALQAGAERKPFSFGLLMDPGGNRFLTGFIENPDSTSNLEGESLTVVSLAKAAGPLPPLVTMNPQNATVTAGASALFSVNAAGSKLGYQWRFNDADISGATSATLTLANVQAANAGGYSVVVFNSEGSATTPAATLTVQPLNPINGPVVAITSPAEGLAITNTSVMVFGVASSVAAISRVEYQIGSGANMEAGGTANWFAFVSLRPGTNVFRARAVDVTGATGAWLTRELIQGTGIVTPPPPQTAGLTVDVFGNGRVSPDLHGQMLTVGGRYTMTALPDSDSVFVGWTGSVTDPNPTLTFTMQPNLILRATFALATNVPPPPPPLTPRTNALVMTKATYNGLFTEADAVRHLNSGPFTLSVSVGGSYSGTIRPGNKSISLSGKFTSAGEATNRVTLNTTNVFYVTMRLASVDGVDQVTGTVQGPSWSAPLWAARAATGSSTNPVPFVGKYTVIIPGAADAASGPGGHGFGTLTVDSAGKATLAATLGDGTALSRAVAMSAQGHWPLYAPLYSDKGSAFGWVTFANRASDDLAGNISWASPAQSRTRYARGFTNVTSVIGSRYVKPATNARVLDFDYGVADLAGGNLLAPFQNQIYLSATNKVLNMSSNKFSLSFSLSSGTFSGSATDPGTGRSLSFKGAVLQKRSEGCGQFLGTDQTGKIDFGR